VDGYHSEDALILKIVTKSILPEPTTSPGIGVIDGALCRSSGLGVSANLEQG
jgi:hypothetical protein